MGRYTNVCTFTFTFEPPFEPRLVFEARLLLVQSSQTPGCIRGPVCIQGFTVYRASVLASCGKNKHSVHYDQQHQHLCQHQCHRCSYARNRCIYFTSNSF